MLVNSNSLSNQTKLQRSLGFSLELKDLFLYYQGLVIAVAQTMLQYPLLSHPRLRSLSVQRLVEDAKAVVFFGGRVLLPGHVVLVRLGILLLHLLLSTRLLLHLLLSTRLVCLN